MLNITGKVPSKVGAQFEAVMNILSGMTVEDAQDVIHAARIEIEKFEAFQRRSMIFNRPSGGNL